MVNNNSKVYNLFVSHFVAPEYAETELFVVKEAKTQTRKSPAPALRTNE